MDKKLDYDVIVIPGGPIHFTDVPAYVVKLFHLKNAPIIISGAKIQTDFLYDQLKERLSELGYDPKEWVLNETDILKRYYRISTDEEYENYSPRTTIQNAYCTKLIVRGKNLGDKVVVVRADYHERASGEFEFVFGPKYEIIDHAVRTNIPQPERLARILHEKVATIQNLFLSHKTPGDDAGIYSADKRIDPIFKKIQIAEEFLFDVVLPLARRLGS